MWVREHALRLLVVSALLGASAAERMLRGGQERTASEQFRASGGDGTAQLPDRGLQQISPTPSPSHDVLTLAPTLPPTQKPSTATLSPTAAPTAAPVAGAVNSQFNITLVPMDGPNPKYDAYMIEAAERWMSIITGDIPDIPDFNLGLINSDWEGNITDIDDIIIFYRFEYIDGVKSTDDTLGATGVLAYRSPEFGGLPFIAMMSFDSANVDQDIAAGAFAPTCLHEMGHALGFGDWDQSVFATSCGTGCGVYDQTLPGGCLASKTFNKVGFSGELLVYSEGTASDGSACSHWDEAQLGDELMTPNINYGGANPLTAITISAMHDLGYEVSYATADSVLLITLQADKSHLRNTPTNRHLRARREKSARLKAEGFFASRPTQP